MRIKVKEFNIYIDELIFVVGFLSIIFKGIREYFENYFMCYLFIVFHELSHMFVASIFGVKTTKLNIRISGLSINLNVKNRQGIKWLCIFLAGPISNVILAVIFKNVPLVYTINLVLAIINLVPIYPLDGFNIFAIVLGFMKVKNMEKVQEIVQFLVVIILGILGAYQLIFLNNPSIILMVIYIIIQGSITRKKDNSSLYQKYYKNVTNFNSNY